MIHINILAVLVAAVAAFFIGFMFHGPLLGKVWMRLAKITPTGKEKLSDMTGQIFANFFSNFVSAYILAIIYLFARGSGVIGGSELWIGLISGFLVWLGFVATSTATDVIWMGKSRDLWLFECGSNLVIMLAMGAIISIW